MEKRLFEVLNDGSLVDNRKYTVSGDIFTDCHLKNTCKLSVKGRYRKESQKYKHDVIFSFLENVQLEINNSLADNNQSRIVLMNSKEYEHNTDDSLFELYSSNFWNFSLHTGNLIGYVKSGEHSLKIGSRFGDNFLKYIVSDADGFKEVKDYGGAETNSGYEWLVKYLWKIKIKKAYRLGLPKSYITNDEKLNKVRGNINVIDYFINKNLGKYRCNYREHSYNNDATKLIATAFKHMGNHEMLSGCNTIRNSFYTATNGVFVNYKELDRIKEFTNPFYSDYNEVIDLSKKILKNKLSDFGEKSETSAFLFDVSMLFEYFVKKLIKRTGLLVEGKCSNPLRIATGGRIALRKLEPDLIFLNGDDAFLFDVKYKNFDFIHGVNREDLFQLHTYIGQYGNKYNLKACGFVYPISETKWIASKMENKYLKNEINVIGTVMPFFVLFIVVPDDNSERLFYDEFNKNCNSFLDTIRNITNLS